MSRVWTVNNKTCYLCIKCTLIIMKLPHGRTMASINSKIDEGTLERLADKEQ